MKRGKQWGIAFVFFLLMFLFVSEALRFSHPAGVSGNDSLIVTLSVLNRDVRYVSADSSNRVYFHVKASDPTGNPAVNAAIRLLCNGPGTVEAPLYTDAAGSCSGFYTPPDGISVPKSSPGIPISITVELIRGKSSFSTGFYLIPVPVVLLHGYQESSSLFGFMEEYLENEGFQCSLPDYDSTLGVELSARWLAGYLSGVRETYTDRAVQVGKLDVVAHSLGGLVARLYSSSGDYPRHVPLRKLIFLSVPHRGSPLAPLGAHYLLDQSIRDLFPDSPLLASLFPSLPNKGLNPTVRTGNIIGQYDEVVSLESASLEAWKIPTEIFNVGGSSFTMDNLLNGNIMEARNHKALLFNRRIFERVRDMLSAPIPYPRALKQ